MHRIGSSERPDLPVGVVIGAGGMGMAIARRLAQNTRIVLADIDGAVAEERAEALRAGGCDAVSVPCDVTDAAGISRLAAAAVERGSLASVVYVAGLSPSAATFKSIIRVNLTGAALAMQALLPAARNGTAAVLISSVAAHFYHPEPLVAALLAEAASPDLADRLEEALGEAATPEAAYAMSKWGMNLLARRQAGAWGNRGARIVSLSPAFVATPMGAIEFEKSPGKRKLYEQIPLKRESTMLEVADAMEFLVSPRASFINGVDLLVDGGLTAAALGG